MRLLMSVFIKKGDNLWEQTLYNNKMGSSSLKHELQEKKLLLGQEENRRSSRVTAGGEEEAINWWGY